MSTNGYFSNKPIFIKAKRHPIYGDATTLIKDHYYLLIGYMDDPLTEGELLTVINRFGDVQSYFAGRFYKW